MSDTDSNQAPAPGHEQMYELIPWYVNGTLSRTEHRALGGHLETCLTCRSELNFQRGIARIVQEDDCDSEATNFNFRKLRQRIALGDTHQANVATGTESAASKANDSNNVKPGRFPVLAIAAAVVMAAIGLRVFWQLSGQTSAVPAEGYQTLSSNNAGRTGSDSDILIVFQPGTEDATVAEILTGHNVETVTRSIDPRIWRVRLTEADNNEGTLSTTISRLKSNENVLFVAQVIPEE